MEAPRSSLADANPRIVELDALRGLAVIGIVWMNVYAFALPGQAYYNPVVWGGEGGADRLLWLFQFVFIEDKFRSLFAMLFGVGCLILFEKGGRRPWRGHVARMAVLFAIGLAHATLLASNDILRVYAIAGLGLPLLMLLSMRALIVIALGFLGLHIGGGVYLFGAAVADWFGGRLDSDALVIVERIFGRDPDFLRAALEHGREEFGARLSRRLAGLPNQLFVILGAVPLNLAAMALGIALWRNRMLAAEWSANRLYRVAALCGLVSIPPLFLIALFILKNGFPAVLVGPSSLFASAPFDLLLGLAYAALAMALFAGDGRITRGLAAVGRLSLSNYLATSVILALMFAGWGFGLFGYVSRIEAFMISFGPIFGMLVWSPLWLSRFGQGPIERLWRSAAKVLS